LVVEVDRSIPADRSILGSGTFNGGAAGREPGDNATKLAANISAIIAIGHASAAGSSKPERFAGQSR